jgi:hypothetical protein
MVMFAANAVRISNLAWKEPEWLLRGTKFNQVFALILNEANQAGFELLLWNSYPFVVQTFKNLYWRDLTFCTGAMKSHQGLLFYCPCGPVRPKLFWEYVRKFSVSWHFILQKLASIAHCPSVHTKINPNITQHRISESCSHVIQHCSRHQCC